MTLENPNLLMVIEQVDKWGIDSDDMAAVQLIASTYYYFAAKYQTLPSINRVMNDLAKRHGQTWERITEKGQTT